MSFWRGELLKVIADLKQRPRYVATRAAMLALDPTKNPIVIFDGGQWTWSGADQSASIMGSAITSSAVNSGTETITSVAHGLRTQDAVLAQTAVNSLTLNTLYYVIYVDADNFKLASSRAKSQAGTAFNLTGTTNFSVKKHIDPDQYVWVTPASDLSGASGAWTQLNTVASGQFFAESGARVSRLNDRLLVGDATKHAGRDVVSEPDWMTQFELSKGRAGGSLMFSTVGMSNGNDTRASNTLLVGVKTDDLATGFNGVAIRSLAKNGSTLSTVHAYGGYFEAYRDLGAAGGAYGHEVDVMNYASLVAIDPFQQLAGQTIGFQIAAGGEFSSVGQFDISAAINVRKNVGSHYNMGLIFGNDSIAGTNGTDGNIGQAIVLATGHAIDYYYGAGNRSWRLSAAIGINGDYNVTTSGTGNFSVPRLTVAGGQVKFPATQVPSSDANTLDDYEEGTFTPTITFGGAAVGVAYSSQIGKRTKIGNVVFVTGAIVLTSKGSSTGVVVISGLLDTVVAGSDVPCSIRLNNMAAAAITDIQPIFVQGSTTISIGRYAAGAVTTMTDTDFTNTSVVRFAGMYFV